MKAETVGAIAVGALLVAGIAGVVSKENRKECSPRQAAFECDVLVEGKYARLRFRGEECDGVITSKSLEKRGAVISGACVEAPLEKVSEAAPEESVAFACVFRPRNVAQGACQRIRGGAVTDPGDENAFPVAEATGPGCVSRPCAELAGIPWR